jgi:pyrimidine deaminase RibD-like protein
MFSATDHAFMARAIALTERGRETATPNPNVACVLVKDGRIIGEGWHAKAGEPHAEIQALAAATESPEGGTVYVTLEPCAHHGRTGPCADKLIAARVGRVVAALQDPFPEVNGKGPASGRRNLRGHRPHGSAGARGASRIPLARHTGPALDHNQGGRLARWPHRAREWREPVDHQRSRAA